MKLKDIEPSVRLGKNVQVLADDIQLGRNVQISDNVIIKARRVELADNVRIDQDVVVLADIFIAGYGSHLEARCRVAAMGGVANYVQIGEHSVLAHDTKLLVPKAAIGDYGAIHNHCLLNGRQALVIGHNVWVGQNCILNSEARLTIGNNVGIGAYSSVYTHGYFGDLLEGCQIFKVAPVELKDDVWILGCYNVISPGVIIGDKALILTGSTVTKDVPPNHTVGGSPAHDMTEHIVPYREVSLTEKFELIQTFIKEFLNASYPGNYSQIKNSFLVNAEDATYRIMFVKEISQANTLPSDRPLLVFTQSSNLQSSPDGVSIFDLSKRVYTRTRSKAEVQILKFLKSYRARFIPADQPRVFIPE